MRGTSILFSWLGAKKSSQWARGLHLFSPLAHFLQVQKINSALFIFFRPRVVGRHARFFISLYNLHNFFAKNLCKIFLIFFPKTLDKLQTLCYNISVKGKSNPQEKKGNNNNDNNRIRYHLFRSLSSRNTGFRNPR